MKRALPVILTGVIAIILLDTLGSIASRQMNFNYSWFAPVSFIIYVTVAFVIAKRTDRKTAVISAGLLGLFDATAGWKLSMLLQANTGDIKMEVTPTVLIATAIFMTLLACLFGLFGSWLATKSSKEQTNMAIKNKEELLSSPIKNQPMDKVTCTNCGAENSTDQKYCSRCGHALPIPEAPIVESAPPESDTFTTRVNKHKGLVGAVFGIIFFALTVYAVQRFYSKAASLYNFKESAFENVMQMNAMQLNQKCPMMLDEITRLDNVEVLPGKMFQYNYTLVSIDGAEMSSDTLRKYIEPQIIDNVRTNPEMAIYRQNKTTFVYHYSDKSSVPILKILVTPEMYK